MVGVKGGGTRATAMEAAGLCFLDEHPPIFSMQCLRHMRCVQSSARRVCPQPGTLHFPVGAETAAAEGRRAGPANVGCEARVGDTLGDFEARLMKEHRFPSSLTP